MDLQAAKVDLQAAKGATPTICPSPDQLPKKENPKNRVIKNPVAKSVTGQIQKGDRLRVNVWRETDLSGIYQVDEQGQISFPLLGPLAVAGSTNGTVQSKIADGLRGDYLLHPQVAVEILPDCACEP